MAMRTETNPKLPFPTIVICLKEPFKVEKYPVTPEEYHNLTYPLEEVIDMSNSIPNISQGLVAEEMATFYDGMCYVLKVPQDFSYPNLVFISLKTDKLLHVYFIDEGQELCMLYSSQCGKNVRTGRFVAQGISDGGAIMARLSVEKIVLPDG